MSFIKRNLFYLILSDESSTRHRSNKKHGNKNRLLVLVKDISRMYSCGTIEL